MDIETSTAKLFSLHNFGVKLGLENIQKFLTILGNPQNKIKAFHIAGSNGKGSTSAFIASIIQECGFKAGLYTSPHFVRFNERVKINGEEIPDEFVANFVTRHEKYIDDNQLTFFEVTTAMAFDYFAANNIDYAVIETGLGGRLDATNVLNPLAVIITSISLEHTHILGDTESEIAGEKAGIIRNKTKVFTGILSDKASFVIKNKCGETGSRLFQIAEYINKENNSLELSAGKIEMDEWDIPLKGEYQKYNAALAVLAVSKTLLIDQVHIFADGVKNVVQNTGIQGRYETFYNSPDIIFDSAHNLDGVRKFLSEFRKEKTKYSKSVLLLGAMRDKAIKEMLEELSADFDEINITEIEIERSCRINELQRIAGELDINVIPQVNPVKFINNFKKREQDNCLVVLGSMYLLGYIKSKIR